MRLQQGDALTRSTLESVTLKEAIHLSGMCSAAEANSSVSTRGDPDTEAQESSAKGVGRVGSTDLLRGGQAGQTGL